MTSGSILAAVAMLRQASEMRDRGLPESSLRHLLSSYLRQIFPEDGTRVNRFIDDIESPVSTRVSSIASRHGFVDVLAGATAMEFEPDLRSRSHLDEARQQALQYAAAIAQQGIPVGQIRAVVTDVVDWFVYDVRLRDGHDHSGQAAPMLDDLELVVPEVELAHLSTATGEDAETFVRIFRRHVFRERSRALTAANIAMDLGPRSPIALRVVPQLERVVMRAKAVDTSVALACDLWSRFIDGLESGPAHTFRGEVYAQEAYLSLLARLLSACVLGRTSDLPEDALAGVLTGDFFSQRFHLDNVVVRDYFYWLCHGRYLQETLPVMLELQRALLAYDFTVAPDPDFLGELLGQLALVSSRKLLGQHATPTWLARSMAISALSDLRENQSVRFLDMCCGTGQIIAQFLLALQELRPHVDVNDLASSIVGIDIDPMAVALAKTTWIAVLAGRLGTDMDVTSIPIYNADSLALSSTWSANASQQGPTLPTTFDMDGSLVDIPSCLLSPARLQLFDAIVSRLCQWATADASGDVSVTRVDLEASIVSLMTSESLPLTPDERRAVLLASLELANCLAQAERNRRDGIWGFMLRDSSRPQLLAHQFNGLVTNPPWLAMSSLANNPYSQGLGDRARHYNLTPRPEAAPHLELATTYLIDAVDRFLCDRASITCLLPGTVKAGTHHQPFRDRRFEQAEPPVNLSIDAVWDVPVATFNVEAIVLRGHKVEHLCDVGHSISGGAINEDGVTYHELTLWNLGTGRTAWAAGNQAVTADRISHRPHVIAREGADLMPRKAVFAEIDGRTSTRVHARLPQIGEDLYYTVAEARSHESIAVDGWVHQKFVHRALISKNVLPYTISPTLSTVVLPVVGDSCTGWHIQSTSAIAVDDVVSGAYFRNINRQLEQMPEHPGDTIQERIDRRGKLTIQQFPDSSWVVLTGAGGANICAAAIPAHTLSDTLIDQTLYWITTDSETSAFYYVGMLNSAAVQAAISGFQPEGQFGRRHIHSLPFDVVPEFDRHSTLHCDVAAAASEIPDEVRGYISADSRLADPNNGLSARRRRIRALLAHDPHTPRLDELAQRVMGS